MPALRRSTNVAFTYLCPKLSRKSHCTPELMSSSAQAIFPKIEIERQASDR